MTGRVYATRLRAFTCAVPAQLRSLRCRSRHPSHPPPRATLRARRGSSCGWRCPLCRAPRSVGGIKMSARVRCALRALAAPASGGPVALRAAALARRRPSGQLLGALRRALGLPLGSPPAGPRLRRLAALGLVGSLGGFALRSPRSRALRRARRCAPARFGRLLRPAPLGACFARALVALGRGLELVARWGGFAAFPRFRAPRADCKEASLPYLDK